MEKTIPAFGFSTDRLPLKLPPWTGFISRRPCYAILVSHTMFSPRLASPAWGQEMPAARVPPCPRDWWGWLGTLETLLELFLYCRRCRMRLYLAKEFSERFVEKIFSPYNHSNHWSNVQQRPKPNSLHGLFTLLFTLKVELKTGVVKISRERYTRPVAGKRAISRRLSVSLDESHQRWSC